MRKAFLIILSLVSSLSYFSQKFENVDFTTKGTTMLVTYDLVDCPPKKLYDVKLTVIANSNTLEPVSVTGDLIKVSPGKNKIISWNILNDQPDLTGNTQAIVQISQTYQKSPLFTDAEKTSFKKLLLTTVSSALIFLIYYSRNMN